MKTYLLGFLVQALSFVVVALLVNGLNYGHSVETLVKAAAIFGLLEVFLRPLIKILLMPFSFLTMGLLSGIGGLVTLWIMSLVVPGFSLVDTSFPGFTVYGFAISSYHVSAIFTTIIAAFIISLLSSIFFWIAK
jgi:putative membrane protein